MSSSSDRDLPPLPNSIDNLSRYLSTSSFNSTRTFESDVTPDSNTHDRRRSRSSRSNASNLLAEEVKRRIDGLTDRLEYERKRADAAERKLEELTSHLEAVNQARITALQDAARANEELKLYKVQLENAQAEIYRAQNVVQAIDSQRYTAEKEAAKNRSAARQLNEALMIHAARDEAFRLGLKEGLERGQELSLGAAMQFQTSFQPTEPEEEDEEFSDPGVLSDPPQPVPPQPEIRPHPARSYAGSERSRVPTVYRASPAPVPSHAPTETPVPQPQATVPSIPAATPRIPQSDQIRPISVKALSPAPRFPSVIVPPDNLIPQLDPDNRIRLPPPHNLNVIATPERPPSAALSDHDQEPIPIPNPRSSQTSLPRQRRHSGSSSSFSHYDIMNEPVAQGPRMSVIPEVPSIHTASPLPQSVKHQRSVSEYSQRNPSVHQAPSMNFPQDPQNRPHSRASHAGSHVGSIKPPPSRHSYLSEETAPNITVIPPSQAATATTGASASVKDNASSVYGESKRGHSPAPSYGVTPMATVPESRPTSTFGMPGGYAGGGPPGGNYYRPDSAAGAGQDAFELPPNHRHSAHVQDYGNRGQYDDDDAVDSNISGDSLTTPVTKQKNLDPGWGGAASSHGQPRASSAWDDPVETGSAISKKSKGKWRES
ncbi:hypothetical protein CVT24_004092 [Panaeolus cyanescens]|uniref:Uncharacterized protein n=1 Tax=Panaeolus cyanescens TaxID=181874 RepID=A0A409Y618_9AGAR|nr:hypothetical protein CVT24_004092 [Panaeolus cyanescens]